MHGVLGLMAVFATFTLIVSGVIALVFLARRVSDVGGSAKGVVGFVCVALIVLLASSFFWSGLPAPLRFIATAVLRLLILVLVVALPVLGLGWLTAEGAGWAKPPEPDDAAQGKLDREVGRFPAWSKAAPGVAALCSALYLFVILPALTSRPSPYSPVSEAHQDLHSIGVAISMYFNDKAEWPPSLEVLFDEYYVEDLAVFLHQADGDPFPMRNAGYLCSYEYVGALPAHPPAEVIVCYLRRGILPDERAVLLSAGFAVETWSEEAFAQRLAETYLGLIGHFGDRLSEERREQLKAFCGIAE